MAQPQQFTAEEERKIQEMLAEMKKKERERLMEAEARRLFEEDREKRSAKRCRR